MPEAPGFQTTRRTGLDFPATIGASRVDRAGILVGNGDIERPAPLAVVFDEPEKRWSIEHDREVMQHVRGKALFVPFVQHHRVRTVMTTAPASDAIGAVRIGLSFEGGERHGPDARAARAS